MPHQPLSSSISQQKAEPKKAEPKTAQPLVAERQTLSEQVYNELKEAIIAGELAQGAKITQDELAKKYGISRGPLREALRRLESIRLLIKIPDAGMRVITDRKSVV